MKFLKQISSALLVISVYSLHAQEVRVSNGVYVTVDDKAQIVMNGMGLNNNGIFRANSGTLIFTGGQNEGAAYISGSSFPILYHLIIDRSSGDLLLNTRIFVNGNLELVTGNLDLNNYSIDLGSTGRLTGESRRARITGQHGGYIKATAFLQSPKEVNPGNLGLQLNSEANLGSTSIIRGHVQQLNKNGELSIERYYEIDPAFPVGNNVKVHAYFLDVESADYDPQDLVLWSSHDAGRNWITVNTNSKEYELTKVQVQLPIRVTYFSREMSNQMKNGFIQLFPNPVTEKFTLWFNYPKQEDLTINLYNSNGQLLESRRVKTADGFNRIDWQVGKYSGGNYQLRFAGEKLKTMTFTKQ
jgi:hypothetical protein